MAARRLLSRFCVLALACALPLLTGCAVGVGQFGPGGGPQAMRGRMGMMFGVGIQSLQTEKLQGQRDSLWHSLPQMQADIVYNLPGNVLGVGGTAVYASSGLEQSLQLPGDPVKLRFKGAGYGPSAYLTLGPLGNVAVKAIHMGTHLENAVMTSPSESNGGIVKLPAMTYQADLNLIGMKGFNGANVQVGWQVTKSDEVTAWGVKRRYESQGPHLIIWRSFGAGN
jgi:hypothetical protein